MTSAPLTDVGIRPGVANQQEWDISQWGLTRGRRASTPVLFIYLELFIHHRKTQNNSTTAPGPPLLHPGLAAALVFYFVWHKSDPQRNL